MSEYINEQLIENTYLFCIKRIADSEAAKDLAQEQPFSILEYMSLSILQFRKIMKEVLQGFIF